jgi:glycyl-tRNA synthetase beta chain
VVLQGSFEERFLKVPAEALSTSMRSHQKSFSVSRDNKILPHFIFVSNIEATDPSTIVKGNEKVMRARLSDALFFYEADLKTDMNTWLERLKTVTFQEGLGSLRERSNRLKWLTQNIWIALYHKGLSTEGFANPTKKNNAVVQRGINNDGQFQFFLDAGLYSKCDLMSSMVYEFPELQGIMGYYYAKSKGFNDSVCIALRDQYLPAFAGDELPKFDDMVPVCLALANKLDQLVGVFCIIKKIPTGDKDPFGLRRATVGIIRILVERNIPHSIHRLIEESVKVYKNNEPLSLWETSGEGFIIQLKNYIFERFKFYCLDQGISQSVINAVLAVQFDNLTDALEWMKSIELFLKENSEAKSLLNNYKRLNNLLRKENIGNPNSVSRIDFSLLGAAEEEAIEEACRDVHGLDETSSQNMYGLNNENKRKHLQSLASSFMLPLQNFFDNIRVDVEDKDRKKIRLDLLTNSRWYFLQIADFSLIDINESV